MNKNLLHTFIFLLFSIHASAQLKQNTGFKFQLNHIDIAVDSFTYQSLLNNKFITDTFSSTKLFRDSTGTEFLVRGKNHFLHFLPDKGFYKNRIGAAVLVHHSFTWKETDTIIKHLQSFTNDSLFNRPYSSQTMNIGYINIYEDLSDSLSLLKFIPILQNESREDYFSWGYTDADLKNGISQERYMQDYVGKETADKLFKSIVSVKVTASADERRIVPPLLKAYGYIKRGNRYSLNGSPSLNIASLRSNRVTTIQIKLSRPVQKRMIRISDNSYLLLNGFDAFFNYSVASPNN